MLPPRLDVKLIEDRKPSSLASQVIQSITPILALGSAFGVVFLSLGWSYAWHWFAEWQVPFTSLRIGADHLFEYGRIVLARFWWLAVIWVSVFCIGAWLLRVLGQGGSAFAVLFLIATFSPWLAGHQLAKIAVKAEVAKANAENFAGWPEAHVLLYGEYADDLPANIKSELSLGPDLCYRLLFRADDGVWLVRMNRIGQPEKAVFLPDDAILYLGVRSPSGGDC